MVRSPGCMLALFLALGACADFPDLSGAISDRARNAPYPGLVSIDELLALGSEGAGTAETEARILAARAANLRRRAEFLRRPVLDETTRRRLIDAVERHRR